MVTEKAKEIGFAIARKAAAIDDVIHFAANNLNLNPNILYGDLSKATNETEETLGIMCSALMDISSELKNVAKCVAKNYDGR